MNPKEWLQIQSDEYLAYLDSQGIKIIGIDYDIDFTDTSWAEG